jgi:hypothetical protein
MMIEERGVGASLDINNVKKDERTLLGVITLAA